MRRRCTLALASVAALALGAVAGAAAATTINFDDLVNADGRPIPSGYAGFAWRNFGVLDTVQFDASNGPSGYSNSAVSSPNIALNAFGQSAAFSSLSASTFTLNDLYLTAAWMDGLTVQVTGLLEGGVVDSVTEVIDTSGPSHVVMD